MPPKQAKKYTKKDPIQHVIDRPDMYVGSKRLRKTEEYIAQKDDEDNFFMEKKEIESSPAILRIFVEALSNAIDNVDRSKKAKIACTTIKVNINKETGETSVWNDGDIVPIELNEDENIYNHTLIFGNLLTGSNYNDEEERLISGRNGLGIKLTNIFSTKFKVKGLDPSNKKILVQEWKNNMKTVGEPKITDTKLVKGYTEVSWIPDFKLFELDGYTDDIIKLYTKFVIDAAMITKIKVYLNDELIPVNNLQSYSKLYKSPTNENIVIKHSDAEVLITTSDQFQAISFVNGVYTKLGGQHVDAWSEVLFRPIVDKFNKKGQPKININDVKQFFRIFVVSTIPNPEFDGQDKHKLESPKVTASIKTTDINKILKWSIMEDIEDVIKLKEFSVLKKSEKKKKGYTKIEGYDRANNSGGKFSTDCSLILCEGLSAKTYAVSGIKKGVFGKSGRDFFGILPLRGKCTHLNTLILLWNGNIKKAKDINVGDILINDMGEPTKVLELFSGTDTMYEVQQLKGENYIVNSNHTLTLKVSGHCSITWKESTKQWKLYYFDKKDMKMKSKHVNCIKNEDDVKIIKDKDINFSCEIENCNSVYTNRSNLIRHYRQKHPELEYPKPEPYTVHNKSFLTKEEGYVKINKMLESIDKDNVIDIDIKDYLKLDNETKHHLKGFKLNNFVKWDKKEVELDPYILGMWLGDGLSNGYGFSGEDIELINQWYIWCIKNNCEIVHNNRDVFTIRKKDSLKLGGEDKRINIGSSKSSNKNCRACSNKLSEACSNDKELKHINKDRIITIIDYDNKEIFGLNPLKKALQKYNLINNKHIPIDYIINDKETRLRLLAGIIDTDGHVGKDGRIEICQSADHKNILDSLLLICRSLGFYCHIGDKETFYTDKYGEKIYKDAYRLTISGNGILEIPTKLPRKKLEHIFVKDSLNTGINIVEKGIDQYVGFMTDKTHRFLLGDFTVTHNCLNVRNSNATTIAKNAVITDLIQAVGLQHGLDYKDDKNYKTLSYGKVILLTDADVDGLHIEGLIMNFFHTLFPTLLEREDPFLLSMKTPIVRVFNPKGDILFYDENRFKEFISKQTKPIKSKYYKGLGTTKKEDVPDTFGKKMVEYKNDEKANESMNKVFHKKFSDERKTWLEKYNPCSSVSLDDGGEIVPMDITAFLNNEVIKFSHNDCKRSIPCLIDGLKESQRKILYAVKKKNLTYNKPSLKVAQLGGYVAEHTNYHHGEQNLYETIIKMAQDFPGSNNIPLFYRDGMFGTKLSGGKDAASPRYIFTKMETLTPLLFREEDDVLLERVVDDGDIVEPKFYVPILPMILINGCTAGIGTGWSSSVPCYNPKDIIECIKIWLDNDGEIKINDPEDDTIISLLPDIKPWYRQYNGKIESVNENKFISYGNITEEKNKVIVNELPIGMWTDKFRDMAEDWLVEKQIKSMKNYSTDEKVNFVIVESEDGMKCSMDNMKLYSYIFTSNMVLFNEHDQLKKYSIEDIIDDFCTIRFQFYIKRKKHIIQSLEKDLRHLSNKARFIQEIIDNKLDIMNVEEDIIIKELHKRGYDKETKNKEENDDSEDTNTNGYDYLLKLQVRTFTASKVKQLKQDIENIKTKIKIIKDTSEKTMWLNDIQEFVKEYDKWLLIMERASTFENKTKVTKKKT